MSARSRQRPSGGGGSGPATTTPSARPANAWSRPLQNRQRRVAPKAPVATAAPTPPSSGTRSSSSMTSARPPMSATSSHTAETNGSLAKTLGVTTTNSPATKSPTDQNLQNVLRERFLHLTQAFVGQRITLTQTNGTILEGIFSTVTPFRDFPSSKKNKYVISNCKTIKAANGSSIADGSTVIIGTEAVAQIWCQSLRIEGSGGSSAAAPRDRLATDGEIAGNTSGGERGELVAAGSAWTTPRTVTPQLRGSIGEWDQFRANETLFSVRASFDEDIYTTRLDKSKMRREEIEKAERIAREIEGATSNNVHVMEERGHVVQGDYDEEDLYSGVKREVKDGGLGDKKIVKKDIVSGVGNQSPAPNNSRTSALHGKAPTQPIKGKAQEAEKPKAVPVPPPPKKNYAAAAAAAVTPSPYVKYPPGLKIKATSVTTTAAVATAAVRPVKKEEKPDVEEKKMDVGEVKDSTVVEGGLVPLKPAVKAIVVTEEVPQPLPTTAPEPVTDQALPPASSNDATSSTDPPATPAAETTTSSSLPSDDKAPPADAPSTDPPATTTATEPPKPAEKPKKIVSKLNANAKEFTFNPSAASFTPSATPAPAVPPPAADHPIHAGPPATPYMHHPPLQQHAGMMPIPHHPPPMPSRYPYPHPPPQPQHIPIPYDDTTPDDSQTASQTNPQQQQQQQQQQHPQQPPIPPGSNPQNPPFPPVYYPLSLPRPVMHHPFPPYPPYHRMPMPMGHGPHPVYHGPHPVMYEDQDGGYRRPRTGKRRGRSGGRGGRGRGGWRDGGDRGGGGGGGGRGKEEDEGGHAAEG